MNNPINGIVIAGTNSGCGKTTVTLGVLAALKKKGLAVQPFKAGPDFIDTGLHRLAAGRPSRNLDLWMCGEEYVRECFHKHSADADISVVEGVMGMYDGESSAADLAAMLGLPVILVVDSYGMAESAGAVVKGFVSLFSGTMGVIFNRVASEKHYLRLKSSVRDAEVIGYLPRDIDFEIPHRHLGLTVAEESPISPEAIDRLADKVLEHMDIDGVIRQWARGDRQEATKIYTSSAPIVKIAVACDRAFSFYYKDNMDMLSEAGAEIVRFSPLSDPSIPEGTDALYLGGGYPELYAQTLSANRSMLGSVRDWVGKGRPVYAECGGLLYLSKGIYDFDGRFFSMAGVFEFETGMRKGRPHLGYRTVTLKQDCIMGKSGDVIKGHEFHYSEIKGKNAGPVYGLKNSGGEELGDEGYKTGNTLASYVHVHFGSNKNITENFINFIKETGWKA